MSLTKGVKKTVHCHVNFATVDVQYCFDVGTHVLLDLRLVHLESVVTFVQDLGTVLPGDVRRGPGCSHGTLEQNLRPLHHVAHHTVQIHLQRSDWKKMSAFLEYLANESRQKEKETTKKGNVFLERIEEYFWKYLKFSNAYIWI